MYVVYAGWNIGCTWDGTWLYVVYAGWNVVCMWCTRDGTWYVHGVRGMERGMYVVYAGLYVVYAGSKLNRAHRGHSHVHHVQSARFMLLAHAPVIVP